MSDQIKLEPVEKATLEEYTRKRNELLYNIGTLEEAKFRMQSELVDISQKRLEYTDSLVEKYNIAKDRPWGISKDGVIQYQ